MPQAGVTQQRHAAVSAIADQPAQTAAPLVANPTNDDELAWQNATAADYSLASLNAYLSAFPQGLHQTEALERITGLEADEGAFSDAKSIGTKDALNAYISAFPNGLHTSAARRAIEAIEAEDTALQAAASANSAVLACDRAAMWEPIAAYDNPSNVKSISETEIKNNPSEAIALCGQAVNLSPTSLRSKFLLGRSNYIAGNFEIADDLLKSLSEEDYFPATGYLGQVYSNKEYTEKYDVEVALSFFKRGCNDQLPTFCSSVGNLVANTDHKLVYSLSEAEKFYRQGCDWNDGFGCRRLGHLYADNASFSKSDPDQLVLFEKACELGDANGCANIGYKHLWGKDIPNRSADVAISRLKEGCEGSEPWACSNLGRLYQGHGELKYPEDLKTAETWFLKGCELKDGKSCRRLGHLYADNASFSKSDPDQLVLFEKACELGDANGCANIGYKHLWGDGIPNRSSDIAISRLKEGCEGSEEWACANLGDLYSGFSELAHPAELKTAEGWYVKGCEKGRVGDCKRSLDVSFDLRGDTLEWQEKILAKIGSGEDISNWEIVEFVLRRVSETGRLLDLAEEEEIADEVFSVLAEAAETGYIPAVFALYSIVPKYKINLAEYRGEVAADLGLDYANLQILEWNDSELKKPFPDAWAHTWGFELNVASSTSTFSSILRLLSEIPETKDGREEVAPEIAEIAIRALRAGDKFSLDWLESAHLRRKETTKYFGDPYFEIIKALQEQLTKLGYYNGGIDGSIGDGTMTAIQKLCGC